MWKTHEQSKSPIEFVQDFTKLNIMSIQNHIIDPRVRLDPMNILD